MTAPLERRRIAQQFDRAATTYDAAAHLQTVVRSELLERLGALTITPRRVLDLGAGTGAGALALSQRYPDTSCIALDVAPAMLVAAGRLLAAPQPSAPSAARRAFERVCADAARLPFASGSFDVVFSNLMLQWATDPDATFGELRRVLRPGGALCFSTFGPFTLHELREAWRVADAAQGRTHSHVSPFTDLTGLGAALMRAGFGDCVLDVDVHQTVYPDARTLMRELRALGAVNATVDRPRGLLGRDALRRVEQAYGAHALDDGALPATWEVLYALAYSTADDSRGNASPAGEAGAPDRRRTGAEVAVPLSTLSRRPRS
jgi:malonyl-CoA O-methyltransferase